MQTIAGRTGAVHGLPDARVAEATPRTPPILPFALRTFFSSSALAHPFVGEAGAWSSALLFRNFDGLDDHPTISSAPTSVTLFAVQLPNRLQCRRRIDMLEYCGIRNAAPPHHRQRPRTQRPSSPERRRAPCVPLSLPANDGIQI